MMRRRMALLVLCGLIGGCATGTGTVGSSGTKAGGDAMAVGVSAITAGSSTFQAIAPDGVLHSGDAFSIEVETTKSIYVYVFQQGTSGSLEFLFRNENQEMATKDRPLLIPGGGASFRLGAITGQELLHVVGSVTARSPQEMEQLVLSRTSKGTREPPPVMTDRNRNYQLRAPIDQTGIAIVRFPITHKAPENP